jgi:hypothetical protein
VQAQHPLAQLREPPPDAFGFRAGRDGRFLFHGTSIINRTPGGKQTMPAVFDGLILKMPKKMKPANLAL